MSTHFETDFFDDDIIEADHAKQFADPIQNLESGAALYREDIGTGDAYKVNFFDDPDSENQVTAYTPGLKLYVKVATANTGPATLTIRGSDGDEEAPEAVDLDPIPLVKNGNEPLETGDLAPGQVVGVLYTDDIDDGPRFQVLGLGGGAGAISELEGVALSSPADGDILQHDGTNFVNRTPGAAGLVQQSRTISTSAPLSGGGDLSANRTISMPQASASQDGFLDSADFATFAGKQDALTAPGDVPGLTSALSGKANASLTISTSAPLSGGGDLSANRTISMPQASASQDGFLDSADFATFAGKQDALADLDDVPGLASALADKVDDSRTISTSAPLSGGGDLSANRTISMPQASASQDGFLDSADFATFASKQDALTEPDDVPGLTTALADKVDDSRTISTSAPLSGGGDLSANRTISMPQASASQDGFLDSADFATFAGKQNALTAPGDVPGLTSALNAKQSTSEKAQPNGYASLDSNGKLPASQIPTGINATNIGSGGVSDTEFGCLDGVTSSIQSQLTGKAAVSHTHSIADISGLQEILDLLEGSKMNIGDYVLTFREDPADGFLECDGSIVSQATYPDLYEQIGQRYRVMNDWYSWPNVQEVADATQMPGRLKFLNGYLILCGLSGADANGFWYSTDAATWTFQSIGASCAAMTYGESLYVAVGDNGSIRTASTLTGTWTARTSGLTSEDLRDVHYNGSNFLAVGGAGTNTTDNWCYSTNGTSWSTGSWSTASTNRSSSVTWANSLWIVAAGEGVVYTSPDSTISMTSRNDDSSATPVESVLTIGSTTVHAGSASVLNYSTNGTSWTAVSPPAGLSGNIGGLCNHGGNFLLAETNGDLWTSSDGVTWTSFSENSVEFDGSDDTVCGIASNGTSIVVLTSVGLSGSAGQIQKRVVDFTTGAHFQLPNIAHDSADRRTHIKAL